jgi:hypothetical protein
MSKPEKQMIDGFNKRFKKLTTTTDKTKLPRWTSVDRLAVKLLLSEYYRLVNNPHTIGIRR